MKQVDTKKLVLACLVIMVLMIIYTKIDQSRNREPNTIETEAAVQKNGSTKSLLLTGKLEDALNSDMDSEEDETGSEDDAEKGDKILGLAEKMNIKTARKEPYGLVVELDYVSVERIALHGIFGYMVYSLHTDADGTITANAEHAVTLEELGGLTMGGTAYTDVMAGDGCVMIVPGIRNEEIARRRRFLYIEETGEITGGIVAPAWMMEKADAHDYTDVIVAEDYVQTLTTEIREKETSKLLYGPVAVPEADSNLYGFLAESGEKLEDVWYGLWNRDLGTIIKIRLFE